MTSVDDDNDVEKENKTMKKPSTKKKTKSCQCDLTMVGTYHMFSIFSAAKLEIDIERPSKGMI